MSQVTDEAKGKFRNSSRITCVWPQGSCLFQARFTFQVEVKALKKKKKKTLLYLAEIAWEKIATCKSKEYTERVTEVRICSKPAFVVDSFLCFVVRK